MFCRLIVKVYFNSTSWCCISLHNCTNVYCMSRHMTNEERDLSADLSLHFRASCRIRTNDPEITNHVLWPTELKRRVGKQSISRRYNLIPLLRSSPGGFKGSWPYRTYPFCGCKGTIFFLLCKFFYCLYRKFCRRNHFGGRIKEMALLEKQNKKEF